WEDGGLWIDGGGESGNMSNIRMVENRTVKSSTDYTISDYSTYLSAIAYIDIHEYTVNGTWLKHHRIPRGGKKTFTTHWITTNIRVSLIAMDGFAIGTHFIEHLDGRIKVKLEEGSEATPMVNAISHLQQTTDKISLRVQELTNNDGGKVLTESSISVESDRVLIGSQEISSETLASIIAVSPESIDMITDEMNLTGNLNVKGQIEAISMSAVEANISNLRADILTSEVITSDMIQSKVITSDKILFGTGLAEDIVASNIVSDHITSRSLEAIEANFGRVQTAILKSNVITSDMIGSNVIRAKHIFVQNAMVEDIVNTNIFTNNVKALSIDAIYADLRSVNSEI